MKHPSEEKSMEYLYGEVSSAERKEIHQHLEDCSVCREQFGRFGDTHAILSQWRLELPTKHKLTTPWASGLKWVAAAAVLVSTAFATGRFSSPKVDTDALQAKLAKPLQETIERQVQDNMRAQTDKALQDLRQKLRDELSAGFQQAAEQASAAALARNQQQIEKLSLTLASLRDEDKKAIYSTLQEIQNQHLNDYRKLRKELETVAYTTDESLRNAERQLVQLASYSAPEK
jgi:predicted ribosome quality control (RQC) complex YloA/Tae2 family protein